MVNARAGADLLSLSAGEVQIWQLDLAGAAAVGADLERLLSPDELARAERLRVPLARARFVAARSMLRTTLARYTGEPAAELRFCYGPAGKPALAGPCGDTLSFNLAHAGDLALLAVAGGIPVGVDVEPIGDADHEAIAGQLFAPAERRALDQLPAGERREAFYRCWVCKEAFVKARGDSLARAFQRFAVSVSPAAPALLQVEGEPGAAAAWRLSVMQPAAGVVAAVCVAGPAAGPGPRIVWRATA
jgi:4'-phosphopantetheinyl transferase